MERRFFFRLHLCDLFCMQKFWMKFNTKGGETMMKRLLVSVLALAILLAVAVSAFAVPAGRKIEFEAKGGPGKVIFDGQMHAGKGLKCSECHPSIFKMKQGADAITMTAINEGKFCGACHNGSKAFSATDPTNCGKCHKK